MSRPSVCQLTNSHLSSAKSTKSQTIISTTGKQSQPVYKSKAGQSLLLSPISLRHQLGERSQILRLDTFKVWGAGHIVFLLNTECQPLSDCNERHLICIISSRAVSDGSASTASEKDQSEERLHSVTLVCWLSLLSSLCIYFSSEVLCHHRSICQCLQQWSNYFKSEAWSCAGVHYIDWAVGRNQRSVWLKKQTNCPQVCGLKRLLNHSKLNHLTSLRGKTGHKLWGVYALQWKRQDTGMESMEETHLKRCKGRNTETEQEQRHSARNH